jgi:gamma-glutamyl hydrolase
MMIWASSVGRDILESYSAHAISETLQFVVDPRSTKMFGDLGDEGFKFETEAMTLNSHNDGIDPVKFITDDGLASMYKLTSISYEPEGEHRPFTASVEGKKYPFFGTQFHPEKTMAIFYDNSGINHSWESI